MANRKIAIIGGGFTGCSFTVQLCNQATEPFDISIFEPHPVLGCGVAYSVDDPDHRLNAPTNIHTLDPQKPDAFHDWYIESGGLDRDPDAQTKDGGIFTRRRELGRFTSETMARYAQSNASKSRITHIQDFAAEIAQTADGYRLTSKKSGDIVEVEGVIIATGNQNPSARAPFDEGLSDHPAYFESPWNLDEIAGIKPDASILIIGTGLTMADVVATLMRKKQLGKIDAVSRHGHLPQIQAPPPPQDKPRDVFKNIMADKPAFYEGSWHTAFDELRDAVWQIWPSLTPPDQAQFLRHLRRWYDSHRFRLPPQTEGILADAQSQGILSFKIARIKSAEEEGPRISVEMQGTERESFDSIINCTGPSEYPGDPRGYTKTNSPNQIYRSLLDQGLATIHPTGIGFDVDEFNQAVRNDGTLNKSLTIIGPPTLGAFGDPLGSPFIAAQISRMLPNFLS